MAETQENIYILGKHLIRSMGDSELVRLLGVEEIPYYPTDLEKLAEEIAREKSIQLIEINNEFDDFGWAYWYERKGENQGSELNYYLECYTGIEGGPKIPIKKAKKRFKKRMTKGEFHETLVLSENSKTQLFVMRAPNLNLEPGRYSVTINDLRFKNQTIGDIKFYLSQKYPLNFQD